VFMAAVRREASREKGIRASGPKSAAVGGMCRLMSRKLRAVRRQLSRDGDTAATFEYHRIPSRASDPMKFPWNKKTSRRDRNPADDGSVSRLIFKEYEERFPSQQNAIELLKGWNTAFPPHLNLSAGRLALYDDVRVRWAIDQFGDIRGCRTLELGPLDGAHTYMLVNAGAIVDAVESHKNAFLRSLVSKEIYRLNNLRLYLGDFVKWLEQSNEQYDLIFACGVLYHMNDPLRLLRAIADRAQSVYLWTVCVTDDQRQTSRIEPLNGRQMRLYKESYHGVDSNDDYCGGMEDEHYWMHRDDILSALEILGFSRITVSTDERTNVHGPVLSLVARKPDVEALPP